MDPLHKTQSSNQFSSKVEQNSHSVYTEQCLVFFNVLIKIKKHLNLFNKNNNCTIVGPLNPFIFKQLAEFFLKNE